MLQGMRERARLLGVLGFTLGLVGNAHASLIPSGIDVWFSTNTYCISLKNGITFMAPDNVYSMSGARAPTNSDLLREFRPARWFMSFGQGLDALTMVNEPGATKPVAYFSTGRTFYSYAYKRNIGEGDLLSRNGNIVATNQELVSKFSPDTAQSLGLDAVDVINPGVNQQIWFSTRSDFYSKELGKTVTGGDLLSNNGQIVATNADLLAAFQPASPGTNYGLDAAHVFKMEQGKTPVIWFSTNTDFYSESLKQWVTHGDILSNEGQVIATSAELLKNYGLHFPANPGLDAIAFSPTSTWDGMNTLTDPPQVKPVPVPEPVSMALLALGAIGGLWRRRGK
jgi:hypothetical protein